MILDLISLQRNAFYNVYFNCRRVVEVREGGEIMVRVKGGDVRHMEFWYVFQNGLKSIWLVYKSVSITNYLNLM